jgi:hypothetical protein
MLGPMTTVSFRDGARASALLYEVLSEAREAVPMPFEGLRWPASGRAFRRDYAATLYAFERRRIASPQRLEVARRVVDAAAARMVFGEGETAVPLVTHLEDEGEPCRRSASRCPDPRAWSPRPTSAAPTTRARASATSPTCGSTRRG